MPSLTAYSCPQFPQTNFPLRILVSINNKCKSFKTCVGSPSSCPSPPPPLITINASASGTSAGKFGNPNYQQRQRIHTHTHKYLYNNHLNKSVVQKESKNELRTSFATVFIAVQSRRGRIFLINRGFKSSSICSSSASCGWRGNAAGEDLQVLRAQVRKLRVRSFIVFSLFRLFSSLPSSSGLLVGRESWGFSWGLLRLFVCVCRDCCSRCRFRREVVSLENTYLYLPGTFFSRGR